MFDKEQELEVGIDIDKDGQPDITLKGKFKGYAGWIAFAIVTVLFALERFNVI